MTLVSRIFDRKETSTIFCYARNGKILCRLDARLNTDDWNMIQGLIGLVYNQRVKEMREALGGEGAGDDG